MDSSAASAELLEAIARVVEARLTDRWGSVYACTMRVHTQRATCKHPSKAAAAHAQPALPAPSPADRPPRLPLLALAVWLQGGAGTGVGGAREGRDGGFQEPGGPV